jgi:hypothetical protein
VRESRLGSIYGVPDDGVGGDRRGEGVKRIQAGARDCRNQSLRCEGRSPSGPNREARVAKRGTGADRLVGALKAGHGAGAKGWVRRSPERNNWKQDDLDAGDRARLPDGSRVRRESHARFYESPAVKFRRPTHPHICIAKHLSMNREPKGKRPRKQPSTLSIGQKHRNLAAAVGPDHLIQCGRGFW